MADKPPTYNANPLPPPSAAVEGMPSTSSAPTQFMIGSKTTHAPLVSIPHIKGHLALLEAFHKLKSDVESQSFASLEEKVPQEKDRKWGWFVALAVERFDMWCRKLVHDVDHLKPWTDVMPPIDVLMVWHSYMLNPRWYGEDVNRGTLRALKQLEKHFDYALKSDISEYLNSPSSPDRVAFWQTKSWTPFDHIIGAEAIIQSSKEIKCPSCLRSFSVEYIDPSGFGQGYLQHQFVARCPELCGIDDITKEKLAARKLTDDIAGSLLSPPTSLAGTTFQPFSPQERLLSNAAQARALATVGFTPSRHQDAADLEVAAGMLLRDAGFTLERLRVSMMSSDGPDRLLSRIMSAYYDDKPYSLDLAGAVLRQGSFIQKMHDLGWTRDKFFDGTSEIVLHRAVARYHGFLDLLSSSPVSFFVPTLDIDLIWHTHQLLPDKYESDTINYVGRYIDHDDKVEGLRLSSAFDITCKAWKARFGISYTHCGCPHLGHDDDDHSVRKQVSRIFDSMKSADMEQLKEDVKDLKLSKGAMFGIGKSSTGMASSHSQESRAHVPRFFGSSKGGEERTVQSLVQNIQGSIPILFGSGSNKEASSSTTSATESSKLLSPPFSAKATSKTKTNPDCAPPEYSSLIPAPNRPDAHEATHPSDHNAVRFSNKSVITPQGRDIGQYRFERMEKRYAEMLKKRRRMAEREKKWAAKKGASQQTRTEPRGHLHPGWELAFLAPIPLIYAGGMLQAASSQFYLCATYNGTYINSPTSGCGNVRRSLLRLFYCDLY
ncbi:hypothetical protein CVT24_000401 [Panaeolus cyanescens]|uniref:Uncharacterized protein n=1 Tax=Panaeolus cyanescens TaxID=181874 RepID=A0A409YDN9_9AGAR|nr:hypothetical protein CVT24_000401 [Panaeolus cyanescens]